MPTYELRLLEDDARCYEVAFEPQDGARPKRVSGSGPDLHTALRMMAHALDRRARGLGREHEDYAGGPR